LLHQLPGIPDFPALQGHPKLGASWEGFVFEQILSWSGARIAYPVLLASPPRARHFCPVPEPGSNLPPQEHLTGLIERVTFFNEETGFAVLRVKARGQRDQVTLVGSLPSANAGEWIEATGEWIQNREYGRQFRAQSLQCTPPTSREGIEKYLASGMVKGIGPTYAGKLVARFGEQIFEVIDNNSGRLEEVEGIGPLRRRRIKVAWEEQKGVRQIMVFLHSHGVGTSRAVRIHKTYGAEAIEKVRANPYILARDIAGIGFKTADQVAQKLRIAPDSAVRIAAGIQHALASAMDEGHCALPEEVLVEVAGQLLGLETPLVRPVLEQSLTAGELEREKIGDEPLVYLPAMREAEQLIAQRVLDLADGPPAYPAIDLEKAVAWCGQKTGKALAPSQAAALRMALTRRALVITGGPGVGKTTLVNAILMVLRAKQVDCLLCAPTGRAAKRLAETTGQEAKTIHRLLEVQAGKPGFQRNERRPLECQLLVVDETSMVDLHLMQSLLRALPREASLLLVGDVDQLPSVGPGSVLQHLIESNALPVARLTEVFRQAATSRIITAAHAINQGHLPELGGPAEGDFFFVERNEPDAIASLLLEMVRDRIPRKFGLDPLRDIQVLSPMNRGSLGIRELNTRLQEALNPPRPGETVAERFGWQCRPRDKVIQTVNNYDKEVFNGDIGLVSAIDPVEQEIRVRYDQREVVYDYGELDELELAYAITIHKAQGSEYPAVVMPLATQHYLLLQRNLVYTGITRGRKLVVMIGQARAPLPLT
jgi:exodeoxyribonuclease V alpha subunit